MYEASTRHLGSRSILKGREWDDEFIHLAQQAPRVDVMLIGHAYSGRHEIR